LGSEIVVCIGELPGNTSSGRFRPTVVIRFVGRIAFRQARQYLVLLLSIDGGNRYRGFRCSHLLHVSV